MINENLNYYNQCDSLCAFVKIYSTVRIACLRRKIIIFVTLRCYCTNYVHFKPIALIFQVIRIVICGMYDMMRVGKNYITGGKPFIFLLLYIIMGAKMSYPKSLLKSICIYSGKIVLD